MYEKEGTESYSNRSPSSMIVKDIFISFVEHTNDGENTLSNFGNECPNTFPVF
jgi:hypothetical protein